MTTFESLIVPVLSVASYIVCLVLYCLDIRKRNPAALIWVGLAVLYVIPSFLMRVNRVMQLSNLASLSSGRQT